jgi:3-hydroxyisobutyrate dehydrogenase-like beta-hydroxyacid dehydrogenase
MSDMNLSLGIIGFGEAGSIFAAELAKRTRVRTYDILAPTPAFQHRIGAYRASTITFAGSAAKAAEGAAVILSLVTASASLEVACQAATFLKPGQIFLDLNSVSPGTKIASAEAIERSGAAYVDGAVMAPVPPRGIAVPILLAGPAAGAAAAALQGLGMNLDVISDRTGVASATKMCRSVIIKGIEALCSEAFLTARAYGVEQRVLSSLVDTFPGTDWNRFAGYQIGRSLVHGRRRAAEMREVARTVGEAGIEPLMSSSTALRQDWAADLADRNGELKTRHDDAWLETLDLILAMTDRNDDGSAGKAKRAG